MHELRGGDNGITWLMKDSVWIATFWNRELAETVLAALQPPQPAGPTVRCRIAVAVDDRGWWAASGSGARHGNMPDERMKEDVGVDVIGMDREVWHYIEADVPIPQRVDPQVIEGTVSNTGAEGA